MRAFAEFSTYFCEPGDFDEWSGEMYRRRGKKSVENLATGRRRRDFAKRVATATGVKGFATRQKGERGGKSLGVLSEVFDIPKMICANALEEEQ